MLQNQTENFWGFAILKLSDSFNILIVLLYHVQPEAEIFNKLLLFFVETVISWILFFINIMN